MRHFAVLDVALGLVLVYLLLSLVVTAATELVAAALSRRSRTLREGLEHLLHDKNLTRSLYDHPLIQGLTKPENKFDKAVSWLFKHGGGGPSYIPSRTFVVALLDTLRDLSAETKEGLSPNASGTAPPPSITSTKAQLSDIIAGVGIDDLKRALTALYEDAQFDDRRLKRHMEIWFNTSMERVSGWYRRRTQAVTGILGLLAAVFMNVDSMAITRVLWHNPDVRAVLVREADGYARAAAEQSVAEPPTAAEEGTAIPPPPCLPYEVCGPDDARKKLNESLARLNALPLPIGWSRGAVLSGLEPWPGASFVHWGNAIGHHWAGWLLTAIAVSLGAPFWFDTLNRIIAIRATGKAPEEKQKAPRVLPSPYGPGLKAVEPTERPSPTAVPSAAAQDTESKPES